jgi:hypothetical protein
MDKIYGARVVLLLREHTFASNRNNLIALTETFYGKKYQHDHVNRHDAYRPVAASRISPFQQAIPAGTPNSTCRKSLAISCLPRHRGGYKKAYRERRAIHGGALVYFLRPGFQRRKN